MESKFIGIFYITSVARALTSLDFFPLPCTPEIDEAAPDIPILIVSVYNN